MDVELWSGGDGDGEKFLSDFAESASGIGGDIFKRICQVSRSLEREDRHSAVGWRTGTPGEARDSRRNRTISNSGTYTGIESEWKIMVAAQSSSSESNIWADWENGRRFDKWNERFIKQERVFIRDDQLSLATTFLNPLISATWYYIAHRLEREKQVLEAIENGAKTPREIVERIYVGLTPELSGLAEKSVEAHLETLQRE